MLGLPTNSVPVEIDLTHNHFFPDYAAGACLTDQMSILLQAVLDHLSFVDTILDNIVNSSYYAKVQFFDKLILLFQWFWTTSGAECQTS